MITRPVFIMIILFVIALVMTSLVYSPVLKIAKEKNLVDNPNARKLQKVPIPVMGGVAVFFGIIIGICFFKTTVNHVNIFSTLCAMMIMLYVGTIDDILDIPAWMKFLLEIGVCLLVIYGTRNLMVNFQGLFGIVNMPLGVAIPLTVIGMVGIINSINLIDGVDGLSSGICIMIFCALGLFLFLAHEYSYAALAAVCAGALVPFFLHNVFGTESKMFIGDGGALMMGVAIASMVINILKGRELVYQDFVGNIDSLSLVSFCLAVLSVPVFDTLRVMNSRVLRGISPFHAERNHLHHHLIDAGLSHVKTTIAEIVMDLVVVLVWLVAFISGASILLQFILVAASTILLFIIAIFSSQRRIRHSSTTAE